MAIEYCVGDIIESSADIIVNIVKNSKKEG